MRLGLYGGSFDPIHWGHIRPILHATAELALDQVYYLPTAAPPHKLGRRLAEVWYRYAMVEMALLEFPLLRVSTLELEREPPIFTVDTVEHFRRRLPGAELVLLIGGDSLDDLDKWHRWRDLVSMVRLAVLDRPGHGARRAELESVLEAGKGVDWLDNQPLDVSSTELRAALARGERPPVTAMPASALALCIKYGLYSSDDEVIEVPGAPSSGPRQRPERR